VRLSHRPSLSATGGFSTLGSQLRPFGNLAAATRLRGPLLFPWFAQQKSFLVRAIRHHGFMTGPLGLPRVLWAALFASTLIYILVLELMTPEAVSDWQALVLPFAFAGATTAGASLLAPRFIRARRPRGEAGQPPSSQTAGPYLVALILALALAESVSILGLVLGFLGAPPTVVVPFFVVTWILMLVRFPTKEKLDAFSA